MVVRVGDIDISVGVYGYPGGGVERGGGGWAAVAAVAFRRFRTGDYSDDAGLGDLADDVVLGVGEVEVAVGVEGDGAGVCQGGGCCLAVVAAVAESSGSRVYCDGAAWYDGQNTLGDQRGLYGKEQSGEGYPPLPPKSAQRPVK